MKLHQLIIAVVLSLFFTPQLTSQNIFRTVCKGKLARLDSMLVNTKIDVRDDRGRSLLHWAVACKQDEIIATLLERGLDFNAEDYQNQTALHIAARQKSDSPYFDMLVKLQPNEIWKTRYGASLLTSAIVNKNMEQLQKLLTYGLDINSKNKRGSTPLETAKRIGANDIATYLVEHGADEKLVRNINLQGAYMGQKPPGTKRALFAPNFISTEEEEFGSVFNTAGNEFYYGAHINGKSEIKFTTRVDNTWTTPKTILVHDQYGYNDPFLSNDEQRLYFISSRPLHGTGKPKDIDIWYVERTENGWSKPINAGNNINTDKDEYYISFANNDTMYFASNGQDSEKDENADHDIYTSTIKDGQFQKPNRLSSAINTDSYEADVFVAPDESYIIFCSTREGGLGRGDLYISFKDRTNQWTKAVNMGDNINSNGYEYCPFVTKDGKYLFFTSNQDIYWVSTTIIDELKSNLNK
ncbi:ankyrin repeat domain-containing protein [Spongiivirga sp. MCCC 1A20706]|uniref:ankyrin repeat domain-containing protein n=1 Tax=Spongiivirga sp. MCCC 1A20706 TaxID=3160963 RepID=UPI003977B24F